jgi:UDP-N-acetylmuramoylalanine--D-glutamate ligase
METHTNIIASLKGRRVAVVGGGVSGLAAARLLVAKGADVLVSDSSPREKVSTALLALPVRFELGGHTEALLSHELLVVSPGVKPTHPVLVEAAKRGIPRCAEVELGYLSLPKTLRYCAITGTNGKTTTTSLIGHIVKTAGKRVFVGGNIGDPLCNLALTTELPEVAVLELSSYQCEEIHTFDAHVAVFLNLTPDHLDRYASVEAYGAAKARLFEKQSAAHTSVLNKEDRFCAQLGPKLASQVTWFTPDEQVAVSFEHSHLLGRHNRENQVAAMKAALALGIDTASIQKGIDTFGGVEHRIERVRTVSGVTYFNDSKATNDDAAAKALLAVPAPIIWLAGGRDKNGGYALSKAAGTNKVKLAILFGEAAPLIEAAMVGTCAIARVANLEEAVARASQEAKAGDAVLLSPACSSFDQFKNYEERGRTFKTLVNALGGTT